MPQYPTELFQGLKTRDPKTRRLFMAKGFTPIIGLAVVVALAEAFDAKIAGPRVWPPSSAL
jgi:hypothetical protein